MTYIKWYIVGNKNCIKKWNSFHRHAIQPKGTYSSYQISLQIIKEIII